MLDSPRDLLAWLGRPDDRAIAVVWGIVLFYAVAGLVLAWRNRRRR